jgi:hypothetical protein
MRASYAIHYETEAGIAVTQSSPPKLVVIAQQATDPTTIQPRKIGFAGSKLRIRILLRGGCFIWKGMMSGWSCSLGRVRTTSVFDAIRAFREIDQDGNSACKALYQAIAEGQDPPEYPWGEGG